MKNVKTQSPTRVDLSGGTLDMWPLYSFVGGATTINLAIDIWTFAEINERIDKKIVINSLDGDDDAMMVIHDSIVNSKAE